MTTVDALTPDAVADLSARELRMSVVRRWLIRLGALVGWLGFLAVWYLLSASVLGAQRLPPPHAVVEEAWAVLIDGGFASSLRASLLRVLAGFGLAVAASVGLGILVAYNSWWRQFVRSIVQLVMSTPLVGIAVLAVVVFGVSSLGPILTVMAVATPYIVVNVAQSLTGVDHRLLEMSVSFGRTQGQIIRGVLLPASFYSVSSSIRLAFAVSWRIGLLTEVFAASSGVGFEIKRSFESYDIRSMIAWTLLYVVVILLIENLVVRQIERRLEIRYPGWRAS